MIAKNTTNVTTMNSPRFDTLTLARVLLFRSGSLVTVFVSLGLDRGGVVSGISEAGVVGVTG